MVKKKPKNPIEESRQYHTRYLRAINSPLRREILRVLKEKYLTFDELQFTTGLDTETLEWHLELLEYGSCIKKEKIENKLVYKVTKEGQVVEFME
ncbi:MAG: winged helix-turn-helix domain-containing protein [Candidatus Bathyarchaeota archaeon]